MTPPAPAAPAKAVPPLWLLGGLGLLLVGAIVVFRFNPAEYSFFPRCAFHSMSGWDCPGCGGQRALHHLLHGNFSAALQHNALLIVLVPVAIWWLSHSAWTRWTGRRTSSWSQHHLWPWIWCIVVIGFGVVRNFPGFGWLRP